MRLRSSEPACENLSYESISDIIAKAAEAQANASNSSTLTVLIQAYKGDPRWGYQKLSFESRKILDSHLRRIERDYGNLPLEKVTPDDVGTWHQRWSANGRHPSMGHTVLGMARKILRYGAAALQDPDCIRLNGALSAMRFTAGLSGIQRITSEQADAVRARAHLMSLSSIALAQAFMFDLKLGQRQVIGRWVPVAEPGESNIQSNEQKWLPGLLWSQIDTDFIMRYLVGDDVVEIDLKHGARMVMEELRRLRRIPKSGPLIILRTPRCRSLVLNSGRDGA